MLVIGIPHVVRDSYTKCDCIMGLTAFYAIITLCAVAVRLYMRVVVQKKTNLEDWLISAALVRIICVCMLVTRTDIRSSRIGIFHLGLYW